MHIGDRGVRKKAAGKKPITEGRRGGGGRKAKRRALMRGREGTSGVKGEGKIAQRTLSHQKGNKGHWRKEKTLSVIPILGIGISDQARRREHNQQNLKELFEGEERRGRDP